MQADRQLRVVVLAVLLVAAQCFNYEKLFKMYAYMKVAEGCFDVKTISVWQKKAMDAKTKCGMEVKDQFGDMPRLSSSSDSSDSGGSSDEPVEVFDQDRITYHIENIKRKSAFFECYLKEMGIVDENLDINGKTQEIIGMIQNLDGTDSMVKEELAQAVRDCTSMANCLPDWKESPMHMKPSVKKAMMFLMCEKKRKALACIRNDLRKKSVAFSSQALQSMEDLDVGVEDPDMASKMLMLLMSEVNGDAFDIYAE